MWACVFVGIQWWHYRRYRDAFILPLMQCKVYLNYCCIKQWKCQTKQKSKLWLPYVICKTDGTQAKKLIQRTYCKNFYKRCICQKATVCVHKYVSEYLQVCQSTTDHTCASVLLYPVLHTLFHSSAPPGVDVLPVCNVTGTISHTRALMQPQESQLRKHFLYGHKLHAHTHTHIYINLQVQTHFY